MKRVALTLLGKLRDKIDLKAKYRRNKSANITNAKTIDSK
jgi:hypothetical protein